MTRAPSGRRQGSLLQGHEWRTTPSRYMPGVRARATTRLEPAALPRWSTTGAGQQQAMCLYYSPKPTFSVLHPLKYYIDTSLHLLRRRKLGIPRNSRRGTLCPILQATTLTLQRGPTQHRRPACPPHLCPWLWRPIPGLSPQRGMQEQGLSRGQWGRGLDWGSSRSGSWLGVKAALGQALAGAESLSAHAGIGHVGAVGTCGREQDPRAALEQAQQIAIVPR
ncbi:hypothetical protein E2C01_038243 [Portunus trituberculatus]|uniref:Uncharacterized protein n=1 Tax=Portunus trituberculatus TaxID=210409 RepID=A0A5B7FGR3_PORTR|nr:hypothetical protein [Portunus trituberculatus]